MLHFLSPVFALKYSGCLCVYALKASPASHAMSTVRDRDGVTGVVRNPLLLPAHPSESRLFSPSFRMMCEAFLRGKAKQTGRPKSLPLRDMWQQPPPPPTPFSSQPLTLPPFHTSTKSEPREGKVEALGGGSDCYSVNVTTSQREPHDTATKSELMDSFLTPVNMTGGVCV